LTQCGKIKKIAACKRRAAMVSRRGFISIRNVPKVGFSISDYHKLLKSFFETHTTCKECSGRGYSISELDYEKITSSRSIKYDDIPELCALYDLKDVNLNMKIRDLIETMIFDKSYCKTCHGFGFVKKSKDEN
jgi:excinuclease UvrABC ATPase subunit